ncbi:MAG: HNH endonuclease [Zoogloeaceae bacterium]|jgi:5-methylcytosine-specific restriction endonuclease McrA|nr:HNH endonuclease [Zoogloeaceae bacterium]
MKTGVAVLFFSLFLASATDARSKSAVHAFRKTHPCPATGESKGACPGWQVDHVNPLKCGGADHPSNMQWLTVAAHKAKTRREAKRCVKKRKKRLKAPRLR